MSRPLFGLGRLLSTPGALNAFERNGQDPLAFVRRHNTGDSGEMCDEDRAQNAHAIGRQLRLMSAYVLKDGTKVWIITEADRSATTLAAPGGILNGPTFGAPRAQGCEPDA